MKFSVGVFINTKDDIERLKVLAEKGINCHLAFMHYAEFQAFHHLVPIDLKISSLHGFNSDREDKFLPYVQKLVEFRTYFETFNPYKDSPLKMVVHPNHFGDEFKAIDWLYPECFPYRKKKKLRTPLDILRACGRMTLDTSHLDIDWLNSEALMRSLIANSTIIHLSQRSSKSSETHHKPISVHGEVPIGLILKILKQCPVDEIALEYMPCYFHNVIKDYFSIQNLFKNQGDMQAISG